jgi:hypothetical protein
VCFFSRFNNNHPFFCFCFADPRHPFGRPERILNLIASLAFGLAATCCVVLYFHNSTEHHFDDVAFSVLGYVNVSIGALTLLLFSGPLHVAFDLSIFFVSY